MSSAVAQIEQAIVQQLRAVPRNYKPLVESYAAQLDDGMFDWLRTLPAIWVTFGEVKTVQRKGVHSYLHSGTFEVLSAQRALGENAGRLDGEGRGDGIGVYELIEHNKLALVNQKLGLPIDPLVPGAIRPVMKGMVKNHAVVIYAQEFGTRWMETYPDPDTVPAGQLVTIGLDYFLKPQHTPPGDPADKSDTLTTQ